MLCKLCRDESEAELLCASCAEEYFVDDCVSCGATLIQARGPVDGQCMSCRDPNTIGPLPKPVLSQLDALITSDATLAAVKLIMKSAPCSLLHAVEFVERRRIELAGTE